MATAAVGEERVEQAAEFLRERIRMEFGGDKEMDARDLERVRSDPRCAYRFAKQRLNAGGDENDCLKMLVAALHFRASYRVNDLTLQDINKELMQSGICYPRGQDREGSDIVYLLIRMHRKEKEKGEQLKRFALYFLEKHDRYFPNRRMSLFMDCSEAGYYNMDLDLVKFIISLFKQYYPMKLGSIYVYDMPWVMNAGWSIIKAWLSPAARNKMRFINKESVLQFFDRDQLTIRHGGTDNWQFSYPPTGALESEGLERILPLLQNEKENEKKIRELLTEMLHKQDGAVKFPIPEVKEEPTDSVQIETNPTDQSAPDEISIVEDETAGNSKKVHFGRVKEDITPVSKPLISRGIMKQASQTEPSIPLPHIGNLLDVSPQSELTFHSRDLTPSCTLSLTNLSPSLVSFKIKTTSPSRFKVQPSMGVIACRDRDLVSISLVQTEDLAQIKEDKFLIQSTSLHPDSRTGQTELNHHWKTISPQLILENRLRCKVVDALSDSLSSKHDSLECSYQQTKPLEHNKQVNTELPLLIDAVRSLCMKVEHVQSGVKSIYTLVIVLAVANVLLLVILLMS